MPANSGSADGSNSHTHISGQPVRLLPVFFGKELRNVIHDTGVAGVRCHACRSGRCRRARRQRPGELRNPFPRSRHVPGFATEQLLFLAWRFTHDGEVSSMIYRHGRYSPLRVMMALVAAAGLAGCSVAAAPVRVTSDVVRVVPVAGPVVAAPLDVTAGV